MLVFLLARCSLTRSAQLQDRRDRIGRILGSKLIECLAERPRIPKLQGKLGDQMKTCDREGCWKLVRRKGEELGKRFSGLFSGNQFGMDKAILRIRTLLDILHSVGV